MKWLLALVIGVSLLYAGAYYYIDRAITRTAENLSGLDDEEDYT